jgi:hypothetical protein
MIREMIIDKVLEDLQAVLIDDVEDDDLSKAGLVMKGPSQGDPDPDQARISITIYWGDPDAFYRGQITSLTGAWNDEVAEIEAGGGSGGVIWNRRFCVKARCLFAATGEDLENGRQYASTVQGRIERALLEMDFSETYDDEEFVSRGVTNSEIKSEMVQGGGPPDAYDFFIKVRFSVQTTLTLGG